MTDATTGAAQREDIMERLRSLIGEYANSWAADDEMEVAAVVHYYVVAELAVADSTRRLLEIRNEECTAYQARGMLFCALHEGW